MARRMVGATRLLWALSMLLVATENAQAQTAVDETEIIGEDPAVPDATAEARRLFALGNEHLRNEEFADAIAAFGQALELVPRVSVALNLALALESVGEVQESLVMYRAIAAGTYGVADPRMHIEAHIEHGEQLVGTLQLAVSAAGEAELGEVQVSVDGRPVATMLGARATSFPIDPGSHVVTAIAVDHDPGRQVVEVTPGGRVELSLRLQRVRDTRPGTLIIESLDDARIDVEGYGSGVGTLRLELAPREYQIRVTGEIGSDESLVELPPGREVRLYLEPPIRLLRQNPWLWIAVGVVVAGVGGLAAWKLSQRERAPVESSIWGNPQALRFGR